MKCEGRGSIVTSPVDVMDDIHGSTSTTVNKQSCSSFPSVEEDKGSTDVEVTFVDQAQSAPSSLEGGGDNAIGVGKCCILLIDCVSYHIPVLILILNLLPSRR